MDDWNDAMQEACDKQLTFTEVLEKSVEKFLDCGPELSEEERPKKKVTKKKEKVGDDIGELDGYDFGDDMFVLYIFDPLTQILVTKPMYLSKRKKQL